MYHSLPKYKSKRVQRKLICKVCHVSFSSKYEQSRHHKRKHPGSTSSKIVTKQGFLKLCESEKDYVVGVLKCNLCTYKCATFKVLKQHKMREHKGEKKFNCNICEKAYTHASSLSQHKSKEHKGVSYRCLEKDGMGGCGKIYKNRRSLQKHINTCGQPNKKAFCECSKWQKAR